MINLKTFIFNPFQVNAFVLYDESCDCVIVDAACYEEEEYTQLFEFISLKGLKPKAVLNTHGHVDHLTGSKRVCEKYDIGLFMHSADLPLLESAQVHGKTFGFSIELPPEPRSWLSDGQVFPFGNSEIKIWHTPGHSPGSLIFYMENEKLLITGDVLFSGSIGRTDLPGGDFGQLINSIQTKILVLPRETRVFPGHGSETNVGTEADHNPFLNRSS